MASRRDYLTQTELADYADITIVDPTEADDQISQAEELIDEYVGYQEKFLSNEFRGIVAGGGTSSFTLDPSHQNNMQADFLKGCWVEIIGGIGAGQRGKITAQTFAGVVTMETAFSTGLTTTSYYRIWQLGKFPRACDVDYDSTHTNKHYKSIPEKVRRATAAQVQFVVEMGPAFFGSDKSDMESESIGDYSYSKGQGASGISKLIAPKARILLRGIMNRTGSIV